MMKLITLAKAGECANDACPALHVNPETGELVAQGLKMRRRDRRGLPGFRRGETGATIPGGVDVLRRALAEAERNGLA